MSYKFETKKENRNMRQRQRSQKWGKRGEGDIEWEEIDKWRKRER